MELVPFLGRGKDHQHHPNQNQGGGGVSVGIYTSLGKLKMTQAHVFEGLLSKYNRKVQIKRLKRPTTMISPDQFVIFR